MGLLSDDLEVPIDRVENPLRIRRSGGSNPIDYATTPTRAGDLDGTVRVRLVTEGDIVELFVDDRYSLAARVERDLANAGIRLLASGPVSFADVTAHRLARRH